MTANFRIGQPVLWRSTRGYTEAAGEAAIIDALFPKQHMVRLTLLADDAPEGFGGLCSMVAHENELTPMRSQATNEIRRRLAAQQEPSQHGN